jgi:hypothetical protein
LADVIWSVSEKGQSQGDDAGKKYNDDFLNRRGKFASKYQDVVMKVVS